MARFKHTNIATRKFFTNYGVGIGCCKHKEFGKGNYVVDHEIGNFSL